jgi:chromosomal replication initiation ATPase DnaA
MSGHSEVLEVVRQHNLLELVMAVCRLRGVSPDDLCGNRRTKAVSYARHEVWASIHALPHRHYSYVEIGRIFGRDHSTVLAGVRAHHRRAGRR